MTVLHTSRLRLEPLSDIHFDGLLAVNSQPAVMQFISGKPGTPDDTRAMIDRAKLCWVKFGFSWWVWIEKDSSEIIGAGCIQHLERNEASPHEIGWRLRREKWGQGFASEGARTMAAFAFEELRVPMLCAVCQPANDASVQVMKRLGMCEVGEAFHYGRTVLRYEISRDSWF